MKPAEEERQKLLNEYVVTSRVYADSVGKLPGFKGDVEGFIHALDAVGTAHRACEQSRIRLNKYLSKQH